MGNLNSGNRGGRRGRPSPKSATLRLRCQVGIRTRTQEGVTPLQVGAVTGIERGDGALVVTVKVEDGEILISVGSKE